MLPEASKTCYDCTEAQATPNGVECWWRPPGTVKQPPWYLLREGEEVDPGNATSCKCFVEKE